ncbi:unnamed protein product (plasmid) [Mycetohabitans rhizoxinica HKI 454]|uniref:Uncharacterized protein n=1 Tax=Mycetohabitans rhizoxinica (strain DSM 19002 / CIP 109453 / HKI 454) TaxID=882378 RepID=E5ATK3_MYCRK|nr:unnamed protein product [Mycetohabitans rhizoxinica HKI 454]
MLSSIAAKIRSERRQAQSPSYLFISAFAFLQIRN